MDAAPRGAGHRPLRRFGRADRPGRGAGAPAATPAAAPAAIAVTVALVPGGGVPSGRAPSHLRCPSQPAPPLGVAPPSIGGPVVLAAGGRKRGLRAVIHGIGPAVVLPDPRAMLVARAVLSGVWPAQAGQA